MNHHIHTAVCPPYGMDIALVGMIGLTLHIALAGMIGLTLEGHGYQISMLNCVEASSQDIPEDSLLIA